MGNEVLLVYGRTGWIGGLLGNLLSEQGATWQFGSARLENRDEIEADFERVKPTHVFNAAGATGRPNVDWCESHKLETIRSNVIGCLNVADVCHSRGIHLTYYGSGCIYQYDEEHQVGGKGFTEEDSPNFTGSYYSFTKAMTDTIISSTYSNVLILRIRMPIVADLSYPRNFVGKIIRYDKVISIPNSMTVLPELLPMSVTLALRGVTGVYNFTNPGAISHNEVLQLYREYVDTDFEWKNFTVEEQAAQVIAPRSNNFLSTEKLQKEIPQILDIRSSLIKFVFEPAGLRKVDA